MNVSKPTVIVKYEGRNISSDLTQYLASCSYKDNVHGKADEMELSFNDSERFFSKQWYPDKKSKVEVTINYNGSSLDCGIFFINTVDTSFAPNQVLWHCTTIDPNKDLRTKKSKNYQSQTLLDIATKIASSHDLKIDDGTKTIITNLENTDLEQKNLTTIANLFLVYSNEPNPVFFYNQVSSLLTQLEKIIISLENKNYPEQAEKLRKGVGEFLTDKTTGAENPSKTPLSERRLGASKMSKLCTEVKAELRVTPTQLKRSLNLGLHKIKVETTIQNNETDLEFLLRISNLYGFSFNIKPPYLIFYSAINLSQSKSVTTISIDSASSGSISDKITDTYTDGQATGHNPLTNESIENTGILPITTEEQTGLIFLNKYFIEASKQTQSVRNAMINGKGSETFTRVNNGLARKGMSNESSGFTASFSIMVAARTSGSCQRFADYCDLLKKLLIKKQASGIKVYKDKDVYSGGQSENVLKVKVKIETKDQADAIVKSALYNKNSKTRTGSLSMPGNLRLLAGNTFDLKEIGAADQKYLITTSSHEIQQGGEYTTSIEFNSVAKN